MALPLADRSAREFGSLAVGLQGDCWASARRMLGDWFGQAIWTPDSGRTPCAIQFSGPKLGGLNRPGTDRNLPNQTVRFNRNLFSFWGCLVEQGPLWLVAYRSLLFPCRGILNQTFWIGTDRVPKMLLINLFTSDRRLLLIGASHTKTNHFIWKIIASCLNSPIEPDISQEKSGQKGQTFIKAQKVFKLKLSTPSSAKLWGKSSNCKKKRPL